MDDRLKEYASRYGTPLYVYQLQDVRKAAAALLRILPAPSALYYSVKANPHPLILHELTRLGLRSEVSSTGEMRAALAAGQGPSNILYTGPGKRVGDIRAAVRAGLRHFSVESDTERRRLADAAAREGRDVEYLIRINALVGATGASGLRMSGVPSQFGIDYRLAHSRPEAFQPLGPARPVGVHLFPATNMADPASLIDEFTLSIETAAVLVEKVGLDASLIDLGGGFAAPFAQPGDRPDYPGLRTALEQQLSRRFAGWRDGEPTVAFESGRYLVAACGTLLTTVLDVKTSGDRTFVVLDAGTHVLGGMSGLGRIMPPSVLPWSPPSAGEQGDARSVSLVGPLCTPLDVLNRSAVVRVPAPGDLLCVPNVGAYGLTASLLAFLGHPLAAEIVVDGNTVVDARRLELCETRLGGRGT
ncbi:MULTISPECIES: type III PLP-dependent enzyme [unclassified Streptomyces]|uniref:type III PLP-dependent enzyme n=1 Tax=unclassified Streptomyces TaxID=2593676 RepID=UPI0023672FEE|nr:MULTISPECIES: type III PLP-dependent enzyme [unclassified Streptomyces]MDF3139842.1 type III PLP-dependent enzyme [Streptomyces sp. T21Q-yed]WDF41900.1 type III PLP-dependent enzyme [Streptomyces sp. T12]